MDESGFRLQPVNRRTWAPRGQTPVQRAWDRHDRLSVIGGVSLAPQRARVGLYFQLHDQNIRGAQVVEFLRHLRRRLRRPLLVVWDRGRIHRAAARRLQDALWLEIEWLPAYAPELNPVEALWSRTKHGDLANFVPDDVQELEDGLLESLCDQYDNRPLKRSFFHTTRLDL